MRERKKGERIRHVRNLITYILYYRELCANCVFKININVYDFTNNFRNNLIDLANHTRDSK